MSPYRTPAERDARADDDEECPDGELVPVFSLVWIGSVVRVGMGLVGHERLGAEGTLAFGAVLVLPLLMMRQARWWMARRRARRGRRP